MSNVLEVKNLTVELAGEKVIDDLSFKVSSGEFLTVIGPNGSGKTVLLRTLLGFILPNQGKVTWSKKKKIGYLPQGLTHLKVKNIPLTVKEFLQLKKISKQKMLELAELVGIKDDNFFKKLIGDLSGGQFQKMLMVWALANNPDILLFDEPMTSIDMSGEKTIYDLLYNLWKKKKLTIILITHDLNIVYKYSTNVLCISKSNICHASPKEVLLPEILEELYDMPIKFYKHNH